MYHLHPNKPKKNWAFSMMTLLLKMSNEKLGIAEWHPESIFECNVNLSMAQQKVSNATCFNLSMASYFLYGLQAAMNLTSVLISFPQILLSHITSFISSMASVVLASSKNSTVSIWWSALFLWARFSASSTLLIMSLSVVPPCTYKYSKSTAIALGSG